MFREMRLKKQLLSEASAVEILKNSTSGVLALLGDNDYPYALPISYVYDDSGVIYFHSAKSGHKIDAIRKHDKASFCIIDKDQVVAAEYTTYYKSVIAFGKIRIIEDEQEIREKTTALAMKYSVDYKDGIPEAIDSSIKHMYVIEFKIEHLTAKAASELI